MNIAISPCSSWLQHRDFSLERHLGLRDRNSILLAIANDRQELKAKRVKCKYDESTTKQSKFILSSMIQKSAMRVYIQYLLLLATNRVKAVRELT